MSVITKLAFFAAVVAGCASTPKTAAQQQSLEQRADATLTEMSARDPSIHTVIDQAPAYAVFPSIGKGGALVGGAYGHGILYEHGRPTGYVTLEQASIGAQLGGETFSELLVLYNPNDVGALKTGHFSAAANASVVVIGTGAGRQGSLQNGTMAYVMPRGGLMVDVSLAGQHFDYNSFSG